MRKRNFLPVLGFLLVTTATVRVSAQTTVESCPSNLINPRSERLPANDPRAPGIRFGISQLTFADKDQAIADPYIEKSNTGKIRIFGTTAGYFLEFENEASMFAGDRPKHVPLAFAHPDGTNLNPDEMIWDSLPMVCKINGKLKSVILGGAMTPPPGQRNAKWPDDNPGRRTYAFIQEGQKFIRSEKPVLPDSNPRDWIGHNYGRDFVRDENGQILRDPKDGSAFMIYEKVTRKTPSGALITELAMRKMKNCPYQMESQEKILLRINEAKPYPAVRRSDGGLLMEGPRIVRMKIGKKDFYLLGFSSGDFPTDHYGINLAYSKSLEGPYTPLLTSKNGEPDLMDLGAEIREKYQLSWGPARPTFYKDQKGKIWIVFHAVDKLQYPGVDFRQWPKDLGAFRRQLYMVPLSATLRQGNPVFKLSQIRCQDPVLLAGD